LGSQKQEDREVLWLEDSQNPPWAAAVTMVPGYMQLNISVRNQKKASEGWANLK